jgi:cell division protein FtsB
VTKATAENQFWKKHLLTLLALGLLALGIHDVFGAHGYLSMRRTEKQVQELQDEIEKLNHENQALAQQVNALKTDPEAIERVAREEMGLARPGEMIFKLPSNPAADSKPNSSNNSSR